MNNSAVINGVAAIKGICQAYAELYSDILDTKAFDAAALAAIDSAILLNQDLCSSSAVCNHLSEASTKFGFTSWEIPMIPAINDLIHKKLPQFSRNERFLLPLEFDYSKNLMLYIECDSNREMASKISQHILVSMLKTKPNLHFRCADIVSGGSFFSYCYSLVSHFPIRAGRRVYTQHIDLDYFLKDLEAATALAQNKLAGTYNSVYEYNKIAEAKLPEYVVILNLQQSNYSHDILERLAVLIRNAKKTGISIIVVGDKSISTVLAELFDIQIRTSDNKIELGLFAKLPLIITEDIQNTAHTIEDLLLTMQLSEKVDTNFASHPELDGNYFSMDATRAIRIPFAIDSNNITQFFEIGGDAPAHALIAGSTGSGKSVALHTLIMQIIRNYHPDDVEIWAVDYKEVEFAGYIEHQTPHFRIIAHDTSEEFSLSLIDKLYEEYERRVDLFVNKAKVQNINQYRLKMGKDSMPRIVVIIDEFQILTQAVQSYVGDVDYRTKLENLLRLTRAMGISFILCSQTIASGLSGLTDAARDQIGCRLCLKHGDDNEVRETLMLSSEESSEIVSRARNLRSGQGIYRRVLKNGEVSTDGNNKAYEFLQSNILYFNKDDKRRIIDEVNDYIGADYHSKNVIIARGNGRISIRDKLQHPLNQFIKGEYQSKTDCLEWYPAAPATLDDYFVIKLENTASANILIVGEDDDLRESILMYTICGMLMNPDVQVIASFVDETYSDRERMIRELQAIQCDRLTFNIGIRETLNCICSLKKIKPIRAGCNVYLWYGLDKLKNEIFLMNQENEDAEVHQVEKEPATKEELLDDFMEFLNQINSTDEIPHAANIKEAEELSIEECKNILATAFDAGPENGHFHIAIFNNKKSMSKSGVISLDSFENRIGTQMSMDDSYDLFGSSLAIGKANENTVIYYAGSGRTIPLHPYLLPEENWIHEFNKAISDLYLN